MRAVDITVFIILFSLSLVFVGTLLPASPEARQDVWDIFNFNNFLSTAFFGGVAVGGLAAIITTALTRNLSPIVLWLYGSIFWTSYLKAQDVLMQFGMPIKFIAILTTGVLIAFVVGALQIASGGGWRYYD